jgi:hypothetical protein
VKPSGEVHPYHPPPSSWHSKVAVASFEENEKLALVDAVRPEGPESMVVSGSKSAEDDGIPITRTTVKPTANAVSAAASLRPSDVTT